ncbi:EamA-like transporter family protein [Duganella sp. HH105]|nr:EamA-like transporter family protein [Duganella sp. HH105]
MMNGPEQYSGNLRAIYAMMFAVAMFSLMDTAMKILAAQYPAIQVAALRALVSLPLVGVYVLWRGAARSLLRVRWPLHLGRGVIGVAMLSLFAFGLKRLSLAEAYTIFFFGPMMITALSVFILKEQVRVGQWIAIVVAMAGVLVVLRPDGSGFLTVGGLAVLASAVCYAVSAIWGRILARTDSTEQMMFWLMLLMSIGGVVLALPGWEPVRAGDGWMLAGLAVTGFLGQLGLTTAFSSGQASKVAPFEYSALAWGVALDWLLWQALPDRYTLIGAAIIIGSGIYLLRHETPRVA